ncbi:catechol 2,3-dioxygenase-like lactoylglutathione lyase family enzyme [Arthrobacter stackebrandtii]|uniref:Catechol 2,3-dioxygenase-like lactoylglutathione lyase family enzyme n=1 Tax=Arthrobacter stackebrandtii TaxID=272161 RepID=A0ABS4YXP3_9MICC|nr:VOC family protein [Arthrobacter stackebrandtii]MBP2413511.1 catechol 2,3-dioxygenase-like lactoylglutathione lyase family enzyme [Arthrobacter stackebrandtii]PYH00650.1 glyoxalase [Arthrobacter stackebrandtii]
MDPRLSFVTLVVRDLRASRQFYIDGLGWPVEFEEEGDVVMVRVADKLILSLWQEDKAEAELGPIGRAAGAMPFTLAHNVGTEPEVERVIAEAKQAGATVTSEPVKREWGGYSGYFADPDGFRWEVACNPGPLGESVL